MNTKQIYSSYVDSLDIESDQSGPRKKIWFSDVTSKHSRRLTYRTYFKCCNTESILILRFIIKET
ncbi:hypothetical protein [Candidatus Hodgkinia cicadicola]|uniref:hypothetical protein n=1 Tax=Candidatus Hodgkinia cicadicola TaxID=573658 RepID=UPI0011BAC63F